MHIGYARVSTKKQKVDRQVDALVKHGIDPLNIYIDIQSGRNMQRPVYEKMIAALRKGDKVTVTSIDRLGRNYREIKMEYLKLLGMEVSIEILDFPTLNTTIDDDITKVFINDMTLSIIGYFAEKELQNLRSRQEDGIEAARARNTRFGRPPAEQKKLLKAKKLADSGIPISTACKAVGISRAVYYKYVRHGIEAKTLDLSTE